MMLGSLTGITHFLSSRHRAIAAFFAISDRCVCGKACEVARRDPGDHDCPRQRRLAALAPRTCSAFVFPKANATIR